MDWIALLTPLWQLKLGMQLELDEFLSATNTDETTKPLVGTRTPLSTADLVSLSSVN